MHTDSDLLKLSVRLGHHMLLAAARITVAESCTAGWLAKCITDVPGSSQWFECGYITYANVAKHRELGVRNETLEQQGAVSEATVREMALGALTRSGADMSVALSGIAGPDGATPGKPVGTVWFALALRRGHAVETVARVKFFKGDRETVRRQAVQFALQLVLGTEMPSPIQ